MSFGHTSLEVHASPVVHAEPGFGWARSSVDVSPAQCRCDSGPCQCSCTKLLQPWWGYGNAEHSAWEPAGRQGEKVGSSLHAFQQARAVHWLCVTKPGASNQLCCCLTGSIVFSGVSQQWWADTRFLLCKQTPDSWDTAQSEAVHRAGNILFSALLPRLWFVVLSGAQDFQYNFAVLTCTCLQPASSLPLCFPHVSFHERGVRELGDCCRGSGAGCRDATLFCKFFLCPLWSLFPPSRKGIKWEEAFLLLKNLFMHLFLNKVKIFFSFSAHFSGL